LTTRRCGGTGRGSRPGVACDQVEVETGGRLIAIEHRSWSSTNRLTRSHGRGSGLLPSALTVAPASGGFRSVISDAAIHALGARCRPCSAEAAGLSARAPRDAGATRGRSWGARRRRSSSPVRWLTPRAGATVLE
jgi:hypothetical protein